MYHFEFKGSQRKVGNALQVITTLDAPVRYWNALSKALTDATHYPLVDRHASAMAVGRAARELVEASAAKDPASVSASSDMVRFNLTNPDEENVLVLPSKDRPGDLTVSALVHPSRVAFLASALANEGLKFVASPMEDEAPLATDTDIFA
jgi:hypothetical protein